MMKIKIILLGCLLLLTSNALSYTFYSINGPDMLSARATYQWPYEENYIDTSIDTLTEPDSYGWSTYGAGSIPVWGFIKFDSGLTSINKMQIISGYGLYYAYDFEIFYTQDNIGIIPEDFLTAFSYSPIEILPTSSTNILGTEYSGNHVTMSGDQNEIFLEFSPVDVTGILFHHIEGSYNGVTLYREFTFEETVVAEPVPEPMTIVLVISALIGRLFFRKKN